MTWCVQVAGKKAAVIRFASERFDDAAAHYRGREEGKDVEAAKARSLSLLADLDDDDGCILEASGSRGYGGSFNVSVKPFPIAIDEPRPLGDSEKSPPTPEAAKS